MGSLDSTVALRAILLGAGALFIGLLLWLERRRRRGTNNVPLTDHRPIGITDHGVQRAAEPTLPAAVPTGEAEMPVRRPLPVIDWSALERQSEAGGPELRLPVHAAAAELPAAELPAARAPEAERPAAEPAEPQVDETAAPPTEFFVGEPSIDHWPPEQERRICSLRIVPAADERFSGRVLRQALQGTGFVHGPLGIYHHADEQGRALISAANLARPGQLEPSVMDFQRFGGVHLFTVLPGPLPDAQMLRALFSIGAELAERIGGSLQDERGAALDSARMHELLRQYAPDSGNGAGSAPAESAGGTAPDVAG